MAANPLPSQAVLEQLLRYEPETGKLYWKERPAGMFQPGIRNPAKIWNTRFAGQEAFTAMVDGYKRGLIFGTNYLAHRTIWKMMTGADPVEVDHKDGDRANNRWANLRDVSKSKNQRNASRRKDNTSGVTGVSWREDCLKWTAEISTDNRRVRLGTFDCLGAAVKARKLANAKFGYSPRHGATAQ